MQKFYAFSPFVLRTDCVIDFLFSGFLIECSAGRDNRKNALVGFFLFLSFIQGLLRSDNYFSVDIAFFHNMVEKNIPAKINGDFK